MAQYDGASRYSNQLTIKEQLFCEACIVEGLNHKDAFLKIYPEYKNAPNSSIFSKIQKMEEKPKIKKRIAELEEVQKAKNQTKGELINIFENNKREYMLAQFIDFVRRCKQDDDKSNELKGLEAIAKLYNLYSDGSITNNQLNQIIIQAPDVNKAIESITGLVNAKQITDKSQ